MNIKAYVTAEKLELKQKQAEYAKRWREKNPEQYRKSRQRAAAKWKGLKPGETFRERRQRLFSAGKYNGLKATDLDWPTHCPVLGVELDYSGKNYDTGWSIDRFDSAQGYVKGNVAIISQRANRVKNNATIADILAVAKWMERTGAKTALEPVGEAIVQKSTPDPSQAL